MDMSTLLSLISTCCPGKFFLNMLLTRSKTSGDARPSSVTTIVSLVLNLRISAVLTSGSSSAAVAPNSLSKKLRLSISFVLFCLPLDLMAPVTERLQIILVPFCAALEYWNDVIHERTGCNNAAFLAFTTKRFFLTMPLSQLSPTPEVVKRIVSGFLGFSVGIERR